MDEQEVLKQIRELQNQRTSLKKQDTALVCKIMELRDKLRGGNIKKGCYYTNTYGLFCKDGDVGFYTPTQCDILADDWEVVTE